MKLYLRFSVITPSYNQEKFIEDNIQSVLAQNYPYFEHIIIDGQSSDNTIEILKKYPHLIWKSEKDRGQTHALNKALQIATGDIICWLNSDDLLCEDAFNIINDFFLSNPDAHIVIGGLLFIDEEKRILWYSKAEKVTYDGLLNKGQCVQQPSTFFKKSVFDKVGNFDESFQYTMDHEFWVRAARYFNFYTIDKDLAKFRIYPQSKTGSKKIEFIKEIIKIKKKHNAKLFSIHNLKLVLMFIKEPFKRIHWLRVFVRKLKGANPDYRYYS